MVGDYVLAVNGTDVTSIPHSEAADLARQGKLLFSAINEGQEILTNYSKELQNDINVKEILIMVKLKNEVKH